MILATLFPLLPDREVALEAITQQNIFRFCKQEGPVKWLILLIVAAYALSNAAVIVVSVMSYTAADGTPNAFKGFGFPAFLFSLVAFGVIYYILVFGAAVRNYPAQPGGLAEGNESQLIQEPGLFEKNSRFSVLRAAHVRVEIWKDNHYNEDLDRVRRFGRRWRTRYLIHRNRKVCHNSAQAIPHPAREPRLTFVCM